MLCVKKETECVCNWISVSQEASPHTSETPESDSAVLLRSDTTPSTDLYRPVGSAAEYSKKKFDPDVSQYDRMQTLFKWIIVFIYRTF